MPAPDQIVPMPETVVELSPAGHRWAEEVSRRAHARVLSVGCPVCHAAIGAECAVDDGALWHGERRLTADYTKASIGSSVLYTNRDRAIGDGRYPPTVQAAIVTGINDDGTASLHVFYKTGPNVNLDACHFTDEDAGSEGARGKWSWPPRV